MSGVVIRDWFALLAPARTPAPILARHVAVSRAVLATPTVMQALAAQGFDVLNSAPEALGAAMAHDLERWDAVIRAAKITAD